MIVAHILKTGCNCPACKKPLVTNVAHHLMAKPGTTTTLHTIRTTCYTCDVSITDGFDCDAWNTIVSASLVLHIAKNVQRSIDMLGATHTFAHIAN